MPFVILLRDGHYFIVADTENILKNEPQLLRLPGEKLTIELMEKERMKK